MCAVGESEQVTRDDSLKRMNSSGIFFPGSQIPGEQSLQLQAIISLLSRYKFPIRMKITLPYLVLTLVIAMAGAYIVTRVVFDTIEERFVNQLLETGKIASESIVDQENKLLETMRLVAYTQGVAEAIMNLDSEALREISLPILINSSIEALEILDTSGTSVLSLRHKAGESFEIYDVSRGDNSFIQWEMVEQVLDKQADETGDKFAGVQRTGWGDLLYISGPILDHSQSLVGVILVGESLDKVAQEIRETTLSQVTFYDLNGQEIKTTFIDPVADLGKEKTGEILTRQAKESYLQEVRNGNITYQEALAPFKLRSGEDVGIIGTSLAKTFLVRASNITRTQIFVFATTAILVIFLVGMFIADRLSKPLLKVVDASSQVAAGNLDVFVPPTGNDEVTQLTESFNRMVTSLQTSKSALILAHENTIQAYDRTIEGWCKALELRDNVTEGHTQRVTDLTLEIAREMGVEGEKLVHIRRGALMHDIGKMAIPDSILKKPGTLTSTEWNEMRKHPEYAYDMLSKIEYLGPSLAIPYCHHEKWDGNGYPRGLKGKEIPLEARIFAVADVWDALRSERPYRKALPVQMALQYIEQNRNRHFDSRVIDAFLHVINETPSKAYRS